MPTYGWIKEGKEPWHQRWLCAFCLDSFTRWLNAPGRYPGDHGYTIP